MLLNITPDHLSWHGSHEAYIEAKRNVFAHIPADKPVILEAMGDATRAMVRELRDSGRRVIPIGTADGLNGDMTVRCGAPEAAFVYAESRHLELVVQRGNTASALPGAQAERVELCTTNELQIRGPHNYSNALAASAAALAIVCDQTAVIKGLKSFSPLEHRLEPVGEVNGVHYINDSKATKTDAAIKAIAAFVPVPDEKGVSTPRLLALFGGRDKGTALNELVESCAGVCKVIVCYGEAGERFWEAFHEKVMREKRFSDCSLMRAEHMQDAFDLCVELAQEGDSVLLSPACASFDEYRCFEERGEAFKKMVAALR
jgi:UDP-N-acetylmuramoylalanine--D-glutamate ligase